MRAESKVSAVMQEETGGNNNKRVAIGKKGRKSRFGEGQVFFFAGEGDAGRDIEGFVFLVKKEERKKIEKRKRRLST